MADSLLAEFDTHLPLQNSKARIDFVMAFAGRDDDGNIVGNALNFQGRPALGIARILKLKDRALGRGDAEISLDGDWWNDADEKEQRALLDHELHHLTVKTNSKGTTITDDLERPVLKMRKHDFHFGWFALIAERHGSASQEVKQAAQIVSQSGQFLFPFAFKQLESAKK